MTIDKLSEFASDGQKDVDDLVLTDGFPVTRKPARQWFNWLFNTLTSKINEIIDADFMPKSDVVDNLTTDDATKPVSANQAKLLQDNKLEKTDLKDASTDQKGVVKLNNTLTSTSTTEALTAAQGKALNDMLLGLSQEYAVVTASRVKNTIYTNTTGRPLYLYVQNVLAAAVTELSLYVKVNRVTMGFNGGGDAASGAYKVVSAYLVVPIGATYLVESNFTSWIELR